MQRFFAAALLVSFSLNANALSILLDGGKSSRDVTDRLTSLGHTETDSTALFWESSMDYSQYDVVALHYGTNEVGDMGNLLASVQNNDVGVVCFRCWGANDTAEFLGITSLDQEGIPDNLDFQYAYERENFANTDTSAFDIVDTSHPITQYMNLGINDLGYTYMSKVAFLGASTTVLANGADGAALVVHDTLRVAITPYYGYPWSAEGGYEEEETALAMQLTENTLQWAAGMTIVPVPIPAAVWLFGSALAGLGWMRRKQTV